MLIDVLPDQKRSKDFSHEKNTEAPQGTTTGIPAGGVIGGTMALLAGMGALAIPRIGPFIAAGPIMGALAGLGVGGAVGAALPMKLRAKEIPKQAGGEDISSAGEGAADVPAGRAAHV